MKPRLMLDMTSAAKAAGYSLRHFRRLYDGKVLQINRKFFILTKDLQEWKTVRASQ